MGCWACFGSSSGSTGLWPNSTANGNESWMARSKSSTRWLREHFTDEYVRRAQAEGYRSRAVYKLLEIQEKTDCCGLAPQ